jgi:hypothetical protein
MTEGGIADRSESRSQTKRVMTDGGITVSHHALE